jgi:hypothetical protein
MASTFDSFITADLVMPRHAKEEIGPHGPLLISVEPAGQGDDATAIVAGVELTKLPLNALTSNQSNCNAKGMARPNRRRQYRADPTS